VEGAAVSAVGERPSGLISIAGFCPTGLVPFSITIREKPMTQARMNPASTPYLLEGATTELTLRDLVSPLFRHRRLATVCFAGALLCSIAAAVVLSRKYESRMAILVNRERLDPVVTTESTTQVPQMAPQVTEEEINSEVELLQGRDVLEKVVLACGLQKSGSDSWLTRMLPGIGKDTAISRAVEGLGKQLKVKIVSKTNLINVSYRSRDPQVAFGVLNTLANLYLEKHVAVHRPAGSFEFFSKEAERYREALQESEARLSSFDTQEGLVAPDEERTNMGLKLADAVAALHSAQQAAAADEHRIHDVQRQMRATPARSTTQQVSNSPDLLLQQLQGNLLSAQVNRGQLLMKYDPSYPLVQQVDQQIKETQAAIAEAEKTKYVNQTTDRDPTYEFLREDIARTQADLASQKATATALDRTITTLRQHLVELDQKALKQADLVRENKANEANYLLYLSKREQERTSDALDKKRIANVAIAIPPSVPALPVHSAALIGIAGFLLSIAIGTAAAYLAEYMDPSFHTPTEVVDILKIPLVVAIPKLRA
jgi:uncharacterized protein involved in exopolysaccharide biosynthesis